MRKLDLTTERRLRRKMAYTLRTAVVEAQAVEAGRHPGFRLNMRTFCRGFSDALEVCLGGVYGVLAEGQRSDDFIDIASGVKSGSRAFSLLECLRRGYLGSAINVAKDSKVIWAVRVTSGGKLDQAEKLIRLQWHQGLERASWDTYLQAADLIAGLERKPTISYQD